MTTDEALLAMVAKADGEMEAIVAKLMAQAEARREGVGAYTVATALVGTALGVVEKVDGPEGRLLFIDRLIDALREGREKATIQ